MKKYIAEFVGTAALCFVGCGAIVLGGYPAAFPMGILPIGLAFGLTVTAMAYAIGPISGCHVNPAVSVAMVIAGRMPSSDLAGYVIAQVVGAFVGCGFLALILTAKAGGYDIPGGGPRADDLEPGDRIRGVRRLHAEMRRHVPLPRRHSGRHAEEERDAARRARHRPDPGDPAPGARARSRAIR